MLLGIGVERYHDITIERLHECDPRQHRVAPAAAQHQRLDSDLPLRQVGLLSRSSEAHVVGLYKVAKVDTTVSDGFRVTLEDVKSGELITAALFDALISAEHRQTLQTAEWSKEPVFVEMVGKRLRGRVVEAKIESVRVGEPQA